MGGRNDQVNVRLTDDEKALVKRASSRAKRSTSDWLRIVVTDRARAEIGGEAPIQPPDEEEAATLAALRKIEAALPSLPDDLIDLGAAAMLRPRLARVLSELAAEARGDATGESAGRSRKGPRRLSGKG